MALIHCPECDHEASDQAKVCPNCGCPIAESRIIKAKRNISKKMVIIIGATLLLIIAGLCTLSFGKTLFFSPEEKNALKAARELQDNLLVPDSLKITDIWVDIKSKSDVEAEESKYRAEYTDKGVESLFDHNNPEVKVLIQYTAATRGGGTDDGNVVIYYGGYIESSVNFEYSDLELDYADDSGDRLDKQKQTTEVSIAIWDITSSTGDWKQIGTEKIQAAL